MGIKSRICKIFYFFAISVLLMVLILTNTSNGNICSNDVINCTNDTYSVSCTIYQNNTDIIRLAISNCSSKSELYVFFDSGLRYNTTTITLNPANNVQKVYISRWYNTTQPVYLISTQSHSNVLSINFRSLILYKNNLETFLGFFPNITSIDLYSIHFELIPKFTALKKLTYLSISYSSLSNTGNAIITQEFVGGLSTLMYLYLRRCIIRNITVDAFSNMNLLTYLDLGGNELSELTSDVFRNLKNLTYLNLYGNDLLELPSDVFRNLTELRFLSLGGNNLSELTSYAFRNLTELRTLYIAHSRYDLRIPKDTNNQNAFSPLKKLTSLLLYYTKIIPFDAFTTISSIQNLYLPLTNSGIVPSLPLQQLHKLTYLSFYGISLVCNCSMQWVSIVRKFEISIGNAICSDTGFNVWESSQYTQCGLTESYQCFNKSISCDHTCINTPDSYICACDEGYGLSFTEDETACHDIDECLLNNSHCEHKCRNTLGSYQCYCNVGYQLLDDLISCTDIDECSRSDWNKCGQHQCLNEVGSYRCICDPGYQLAGDRYSCHDLDECSNASLNTCNQHTCINELGTYTCCCNSGYQPATNGNNCEDIDECSSVESNRCGDHQCINEQGSYSCICDEGFQLAFNDFTCHDIDECVSANNSCIPHTCINLVGSYMCLCSEGYNLPTNATSCEDIDECSLVESNRCGDHQCINEQGSYRCICEEGFQLAVNNISCHDINECVNGKNSCRKHACLNLVGSYTCSCIEGYQLTSAGKSCEKLDECSNVLFNQYEQHLCINEKGNLTILGSEMCNFDLSNLSYCLQLEGSSRTPDNLSINTSENSNKILIGVLIFLVSINIALFVFFFTLLLYLLICKNKSNQKDIARFHENQNQEGQSEYLEMHPAQKNNDHCTRIDSQINTNRSLDAYENFASQSLYSTIPQVLDENSNVTTTLCPN